ncbi:flavodoxin family protein [Clostridia bacterium]|nr:flavodoxin family protein [Clostridia bacterium]
MNLLAVVCSPKKHRNTDTLIDAVLEGAKESGITLNIDKVYVNSLKFRPCQDCGYCRKVNGCSLRDDMDDIYPLIEHAHGVIVGAPTYYGGMNAQCKMFIDRQFRYNEMVENDDESWTFQSRIALRKKLIFAGTNGSFGDECCNRQEAIIDHLCNDINAEHYENIYAHKTDYYPVKENESLLDTAKKLGKRWVQDIEQSLL